MSSESSPRPAPTGAGPCLLAHDLKGLAGRLGLLLQNLDERYDDPLFKRPALELLDATIGHLRRLASDLRDRDGRVLMKLRVDLNALLEQALAGMRPELAGDVDLRVSYEKLPPVWGDAFILRAAFGCAIENGLEAMDRRGQLTIRTATGIRGGRATVRVDIEDSGRGMSPDFLRRHLFRPFASTKDDGMGLGAYTFLQVARLHGGSVRARSRVGEGTRIRFTFPVDRS